MPIPSTAYPISPQSTGNFTTYPITLYPTGGTANTLQATGFIPSRY